MSELIRILPDHIANQIAAGEVIQRPASVIKELVENAIDAGSSKIDVYIKDSGKTLIQVVDNGIGMSEIDARMCFERHATSKIKTAEDLFLLQTKGFRGEALASIAAIAHVEMTTRQDVSDVASQIIIEGSKIIEQTHVSAPIGTSFKIKNLFFNVPARRNFLKSDSVEFSHIEEEFLRIVLAHPSIQFSLTHNDQNIYTLVGANLRKRIVDIYGRNYNDRLVPIEVVTGIVTIVGFIGKPEFAKKSRGEQYMFVNNRFFKDSYFNHAIVSSYDGLIQPKYHPSYFLFFEINPSSIDVNVHPTKTEIKFEDDKEIYSILKSGIKQGLGKFNIVPTLDFEQEMGFDIPWEMTKQPVVEPSIKVNENYNPFHQQQTNTIGGANSTIKSSGSSPALNRMGFGHSKIDSSAWEKFYNIEEDSGNKEENIQVKLNDLESDFSDFSTDSDGKGLNVAGKFIVQGDVFYSSIKSGLMAIHAKRAQERILYDEIMQSFIVQPIESQQMLFPIEYQLTKSEINLWNTNQKTLNQLGFYWQELEHGISIFGVPSYFQDIEMMRAIQLIDSQVKNDQIEKGEIAHNLILSIAKVSAKSPKNWTQEQCSNIVERLFQCEEHQYSPSGKKIIVTINTNELFN